jgi:hypothetical protein
MDLIVKPGETKVLAGDGRWRQPYGTLRCDSVLL